MSIFGNTVLTYDTIDYGSGYVLIENSFVVSGIYLIADISLEKTYINIRHRYDDRC